MDPDEDGFFDRRVWPVLRVILWPYEKLHPRQAVREAVEKLRAS